MASKYSLKVNGRAVAVEAEAEASLLSVLREELDLTGTKYGCGEGQCGACTVLVEGRAQRSCVTRIAAVAGKAITTIEGLATGERLHPVQQAFVDAGAFQCAYCTPGMIMSSVGLLKAAANPSEAEIEQSLQGNICRCGTHPRIVAAVQQAAKAMQGGAR